MCACVWRGGGGYSGSSSDVMSDAIGHDPKLANYRCHECNLRDIELSGISVPPAASVVPGSNHGHEE